MTATEPDLTVIIPAHNPDPRRLRATLDGLRRQTLPADRWVAFIVDNASNSFPAEADVADVRPPNLRILREPQLGLSAARRRGFTEATTEFLVLVDDDNVLAADYLANVLSIFAAHPRLGLAGGKTLPEFEANPPAWVCEFFSLLALRDLGERELVSRQPESAAASRHHYPLCAPIGAGLAARAAAVRPWLDTPSRLTDRHGTELSSAGDNDIVLTALAAGWEVGYFPQLSLTHLIPAARLEPAYLARLNRGIQRSWQQVLALHGISPWPPLTPAGAALRKVKAWVSYRAWRSPATRIRWRGACGHFEGRVQTTRP